MVEHLGLQLNALVEELRTVADPDAAEAQIESVTADAAEQVAAASARASRAEQAPRTAETERVEADAAAVEASELAAQQQVSLTDALEQLETLREALSQFTVELAEARTAGETHDLKAQADLAELRDQLTSAQTRLAETEQARDAAMTRAEAATTARAEAEERARGAVDRALRAETDAVGAREQLEKARTQRDELREETSTLRSTVATVTVERDAARTETGRESAHGDQRVADLRLTQEQQLSQLRSELAEARQDARGQHT